MEKINLPDGQVINIPDNIDPEKRSQLAGAIKRQYDIDIDKVSILDRVVDAPKSVARGAISTVASVPLGLASLFDIGNDSEVVKGLQGFRDYIREDSIFASDPSLRNKYSTKLAEGFGSFGPFLGAGLAGRALARRGVVSPAVGTFGLPAALAVPTGISEQVDRLEIARDMGEEANAGQEILSELIGGAIGLSEIAPIAAFLKRVPKSAARNPEINARITQIAKDFTTGFAFEGAQESIASLTQDLVARGLYSDTLPIGESFFDELTIGGIVGGTAKAVINSLGRKQGIKSEYAEEKIRREQENKKDLLRAKKFQQAQEQGTLTEVQDVPQVVKPELVVPEATLPEPDLTVVSLPNNTFSIVDNNNTTQPIVETFTSEADALSKKEELLTDFNNQRLTQELNKQLYLQGNINSATAFEIGQSLLDPIATTVTPNDIIAFRTKISDKAKQSFLENNTKPLTLEEAKKNLTKKEFNDLASALARAQLKANEKNGQPSITAGKDSINTTPKYIKELAESKNIDNFNPNSPAIAHALKIYTGSNDLKGMSKGQKELLVARLHALPKFNQKQEFPDFRPKEYSAKDMADFISKIDKASFTLKDVENNFDGDKGKAAMFISQLQKSGRAEFLKEEGAYRIKDNFEFEIARRAEAFDQTPEEFGASLREQGTLSEDVIAKLVEEETVRQEKVLPPEEIEPKLINFAEAIEEGRTNKFAKEIRKQLDKFGLSDTGVVVSDDILSTTTLRQTTDGVAFDPREVREERIEGEYDRNTDIIFLSLNAVNPDGNATDFEIEQRLRNIVNHEVIHALRAKDLLTEPEYNYLRKLVKQRKVPKDFDENYANRTFYDRAVDINRGTIEARRQAGLNISDERAEELYIEEAIAEMYRAKDIGPTMPNKVDGIFNKFIEFFKGIGQAMRTSGYKNVANVFAEIEQGRVGRRARGELRTTRELDRGAAISQLPPDLQAEKDRRDRAAAEAQLKPDEIERGAVIKTELSPQELSRLEPVAPTRPTPPPPPPPPPPVVEEPTIEPEVKPEVPDARPPVKPEEPAIETTSIPNTIYDSTKRTLEEKIIEEAYIAHGLAAAGVITVEQADRIGRGQGVRTKGDTIKMLKWFTKNSPSEDYRILATKALETLNKLKKYGVTLPFSISSVQAQGRVAFQYSLNLTDSISNFELGTKDMKMTINSKTGLDFETILHETLHSSSLLQLKLFEVLEKQNLARKRKGSTKPSEISKVPEKILSTKTIKAFRNLNEQRQRVLNYIENQKVVLLQDYKNFERNKKTGDRYYRKDLDNNPILKQLAFAIAEKEMTGRSTSLQQWDRVYVDYYLKGRQATRSRENDSSEFITFGFTNRPFQNFLENIPYDDKGKKTVWNKFVEAIRDILNLPAKLDTEFAAFLNNAADIFYNPEVTQEKLRAPPTSIDSRRAEIEEKIFAAEDMIYRLEREEYLEGDVMTVGSLNRLQGRIRQQKRNLAFFKNELANLSEEIVEPEQLPLFSKGVRYNKNKNSSESRQLQEAVTKAEEQAKSQPRGGIPRYNTNASDIALKTAIDFENDPTMSVPDDIPNWSKPTLDGVDNDIRAGINRTGGQKAPEKSFGARLLETLKDPVTNIGFYFRDFRQNYVDKLDKTDKKILKGIQKNEQVRAFNNTADTATMAALRLADRARGLFQGLLTTGTISDKIDGVAALANVVKSEDGGLIQILAPLYSRPEVDQESIFKFYASLKRTEQFQKDGRVVKSPIKEEDLALIKKIEVQYPDVKNVFEAYQRWNNTLITFAENKGLLSKFKSNNKIIEELEKKGIDQATLDRLAQLSKENGGRSVQEIREFAVQNDIDIRGQADLWREHSSYYPFYRDMVDDTGITAPTVAGGSLPNNPLSISLEGSEDPLNINPLEAISRNSLSILTASLKNDGLAKLIRDLELMGEAKEVTPKESAKLNTIFVFDEGIKRHYEVDVELVNALQSVGGTQRGMIEKVLAMPAGFLRETVTRDPGFVVVNILRDTFSTMVTSGADFVPVIDSFKNLVGDMENLKKFGVLGGYDFSNDEGSVKEYITRTMRREGLTPDNGMSAQKLFFKLWDGLGELTTRSDGATRQAVYDGVYKKLIKEGYNEAQAQSEAAYQALEIINFGRRGLNPTFKIITAAIPFFNARIQGLDIIYRAGSGKYSAVEKLQQGETLKDVQGRILKNVALKSGVLSAITLIYYLLVHDSDEYKNLKREVRDDNWVVPVGFNHAVKIPIPFEVGFLFKVVPERFFDMTLGDEAFTRSSVNEAGTSISRGLGTSLAIPFFDAGGVQALKPIVEALINKNSFTKQDIVPYYQLQKEPALQFREGTSQLAKEIGEQLNISPAKVEHVFRGYTGTLGGYVVALSDTITRLVTGEPLMPKNASFLQNTPLRRLLLDYDKSGGLQQQFYELRGEVDRAVATINSLKKEKRFDELSAYRTNRKGVLDIKGQIRALEKYLANFRERRNRLLLNENISVAEKSERLRQMEIERDKRLAFVPELRKRANLPVINMNPF